MNTIMFFQTLCFSFTDKTFNICISAIAYLQFACATKGLFLCGGIAYDKIFDRDEFFYGKGLNRAYVLESKVACYPRVILDPSLNVIDGFLDINNKNNSIRLLEQFRQDSDGCYYIDFFVGELPRECVALYKF